MMNDYMLPSLPAVLNSSELTLEIRMPWYRALPLSSITNVRVSLDSHDCDMEKARFELNGNSYSFSKLPELPDKWWYVLDSAWITVQTPDDFRPGRHSVKLHFGMYIPYLPVGSHILLVEEESERKLDVIAA